MRVSLSCVLAAAALAGCSGGKRPATVIAPPPEPDAATSLTAQPLPLTADQRAHLQMRTRWAVSPELDRTIASSGPDFYLRTILEPVDEPALEAEAAATIPYPLHPTGPQISVWWVHLMSKTVTPFRDVMAMFWHDHFAVSHAKFGNTTRHLVHTYAKTLRREALGNFRRLVHAMIQDGAMQVWLDGVASTAQAPNENLARELFERFTLGVGNGYTATDIAESARALTGYTLVPYATAQTVQFDASRHDAGSKTVFGMPGTYDAQALVELIFSQRDPATFVARRLFEHFCYPDAPQQVVADLAAVLREHDYAIQPTLRVLLRSRAFYSAKSRRSHIKTPLESAVGFLRATELAFEPAILDLILNESGYRPAEPPDVGGWPEGETWLTAGSLALRGRLLHAIATDREPQARRGTDLLRLLPLASERNPTSAVQSLAARLDLTLDADDVATYATYLDTRTFVQGEELMTERDPFRFERREHVSERLRGLLFLLSQHPSFLLR